jgi:hypothetical protein
MRDWITYRLLGRCWATGCGRPMLLHTPRRRRACDDLPLGIELTEQGRREGLEPESVRYRQTS